MCELDVYKEGKKIAEGVVKITAKNGKIEMYDVLGTKYIAEGTIAEVDITNEKCVIGSM